MSAEENNEIIPPPSDKPDDISNKLTKFIDKFSHVADSIINRYDDDRKQINEFIDEWSLLIKGDDKPNRGIIDNIATLIRAKADNNASAVALLDSFSKLLAASKNNDKLQVNNNFNIGSGQDINDIISKIEDIDDES